MVSPDMTGLREKCDGCSRNILIHNPVSICDYCSKPTHTKCSKNYLRYNNINDTWVCRSCEINAPKRYNPFSTHVNTIKAGSEPSHDVESDIHEINKILNSCQEFTPDQINKLRNSQKVETNEISVLFNNIDGNYTNFDSLCSELSLVKQNFSIIALAETNIDACHGQLYQMSGYNAIYQSKINNKQKGSGLALYVSDSLEYCETVEYSQCTVNLEALFITIKNTSEVLTVGVVYRPPSGTVSAFMTEFEELLNTLPNKNVLICGDFNIDLHKPNNEYENLFYSHGYIPTISIKTHEKLGCTPSCIDNIFVNSWEAVSRTGVLCNRVSAHFPLFCTLAIDHCHNVNTRGVPRYDTCDSNIDIFVDKLANVVNNHSESIATVNCESSFEQLNTEISDLVDQCFVVPPNTKTSKRNKFVNPWITPGIIASVNKKNFLYKRWKKTCTRADRVGNNKYYLDYSNFRRKLKHIIKKAKKMHYGEKFKKFNGNIKKTWQLINELRGKSNRSIKPSFMVDGNLVQDRRLIANGFNKYFTSIAKNLNDDIEANVDINTIPPHESYFDKTVMSSIYLNDCDINEVTTIIKDLDSNKSSDIPVKIIKHSIHLISPVLCKYLNIFMAKGLFPNILKVGRITPIYKKGDPQVFGNYRPVSTLPLFGKIFEKIIYNRLHSYLASKNILYKNQFGFRKNHSTSHAINYSVQNITKKLENGRHVLGIFIDLSKAFDTIDHNKLLKKLYNYGIRGQCYELLKNYLLDRQQYTEIFNEKSLREVVLYGVPQGSVLGPLLFLLYINDIVNVTTNGEFVLFADDTNIFVVGKDRKEAFTKANEVLRKIYLYMISNQLHINMGKCCYMYFRPSKIEQNESYSCARIRPITEHLTLYLNGCKIPQVSKTKFLGVIIDDKLSWEDHISHIENKLKSCLVVMKRVVPYVPKTQYNNIYHSLFLSHLTYGISAWGGVPKYKLNKIFSIQKRCIRLLFGVQFSYDHSEYYETCARVRTYDEHCKPKDYCLEHTKPLFTEYKLLTVHNLYLKHMLTETFKILKYRSPHGLYSEFRIKENKYITGVLLSRPNVKLSTSKHNYLYKSSILWNDITNEVFASNVLNSSVGYIVPGERPNSDLSAALGFFKNRLKLLLLESQTKGCDQTWEEENF